MGSVAAVVDGEVVAELVEVEVAEGGGGVGLAATNRY